jgi:hypothetical protein
VEEKVEVDGHDFRVLGAGCGREEERFREAQGSDREQLSNLHLVAVCPGAGGDSDSEQLRQQIDRGLHILRTSAHFLELPTIQDVCPEDPLRNQQDSKPRANPELLLLQSHLLPAIDV